MGKKKTKVIDTTPQATQDMRKGLANFINDPAQGGMGRINAQTPELPGSVATERAGPVSTQFNAGGVNPTRSMTRDVEGGATQSVDQLGGQNSAFFNNMMGQLAPAFQQQRQEGLAAAKESAGSLTGSGFANRLGASINRSLGAQQAQLANYAAQGLQTEVGRQQGDAGRALQAGMANQGADQTFINQMLARGDQNLETQRLGFQAQTQNQNTALQENMQAADLEAKRRAMGFTTGANVNMQNAQNFTNLLGGQATAGVTPSTVQESGGGFGSFIGKVGGGLLGSALGPVGSAIGTKVGGALASKIF